MYTRNDARAKHVVHTRHFTVRLSFSQLLLHTFAVTPIRSNNTRGRYRIINKYLNVKDIMFIFYAILYYVSAYNRELAHKNSLRDIYIYKIIHVLICREKNVKPYRCIYNIIYYRYADQMKPNFRYTSDNIPWWSYMCINKCDIYIRFNDGFPNERQNYHSI